MASRKQLRNLNLFWLGFGIYFLSVAFYATDPSTLRICQSIQVAGLLLMFMTVFSLVQFKFDNTYLQFVFILYCAWLFATILRGYNSLLDYTYLKYFLFNPRYGGMLYFAPLILLFPRNLVFYKKLVDVILLFAIVYIIYDILFIKDLLDPDRTTTTKSQAIVETFSDLSFSCGFILLTYSYYSKKRRLLGLFVVALALFFAIVRGRRGLTFMYGNVIFISYILFILQFRMRFLIIYLTLFIAVLAVLYFSEIHKPRENHLFGFLLERGVENTRERVELYFHDDMKIKDWLIGRGIRGQYFCPDVDENQVTNYRPYIETGYLQTILKGGLISIGLFLLIAVPAIIKGLFDSKNILSKVSAIWIFMSLINSYPVIVNAFTLQYLLVWVSIGICYSPTIRNLPERSIKKQFLLMR